MPQDRVNPHNLPALPVVAVALVDARGRVLMQQRPAGRDHAGLWEFPGGKLEPGEGPMAALVRELHEELAIGVASDDLVPLGFAASEQQAGARSVILLLYGCRAWEGKVASQEGAICRWLAPAALAALPMPPLDVPLAELARCFAESVCAPAG
jgi:8-oxo-dGTP diphosphatase